MTLQTSNITFFALSIIDERINECIRMTVEALKLGLKRLLEVLAKVKTVACECAASLYKSLSSRWTINSVCKTVISYAASNSINVDGLASRALTREVRSARVA